MTRKVREMDLRQGKRKVRRKGRNRVICLDLKDRATEVKIMIELDS